MTVIRVVDTAQGTPVARDTTMFGRSESKIKEFTKLAHVRSRAEERRDTAQPVPDDDGPSDLSRPLERGSAPVVRREHEGHVVIGEGVKIVGEIRDCRKIEIRGTVEGDLEAEELIVHENGLLKGSVKTDRAQVNGTIDGDIIVMHLLDVKAKGSVAGTTQYGELSIETGGRIVGTVDDRFDRKAVQPGVTSPGNPAEVTGPGSANDYGFTRGFTPKPVST